MNKIYDKYKIELPKIYEILSRTGCLGCVYGSYKHEVEKELALANPNQRKFVCEYFKESYKVLGINTEEKLEDDKNDI